MTKTRYWWIVSVLLALGVIAFYTELYPFWNSFTTIIWLMLGSAASIMCWLPTEDKGTTHKIWLKAGLAILTMCLMVPLFVTVGSENRTTVIAEGLEWQVLKPDQVFFKFLPTVDAVTFTTIVVTDRAAGIEMLCDVDATDAIKIAQYYEPKKYAAEVHDFFSQQLTTAKQLAGAQASTSQILCALREGLIDDNQSRSLAIASTSVRIRTLGFVSL